MFGDLSKRLSGVFAGWGRGQKITEEHIDDAMRGIRVALLESDVPLPVIMQLIGSVREKIVGSEVLKSISPEQMIIKAVNDGIVSMLGGDASADEQELTSQEERSVIMLVGLQGAGKTTTSAKLAARLKARLKKRVLLASLDVYRPAAMRQLEKMGQQAEIDVFAAGDDSKVLSIAERALEAAKSYDVLILDTAGRIELDQAMMSELQDIKSLIGPGHIIYVIDAAMGQEIRKIVKAFDDTVGVTGLILTKADGDAAAGSVLSACAVTGRPIIYTCSGEKIGDIDVFMPKRVAGRILGMGDIVSLVEKASETISEDQVESIGNKLKKGTLDMDDYAVQLGMIKKMDGAKGLMSFLPKNLMNMGVVNDELTMDNLTKSLAIISSMTKVERVNPEILESSNSRKKRVADGAGVRISDLNRLLKDFFRMKSVVQQFASVDLGGLMKNPDLSKIFKKLVG